MGKDAVEAIRVYLADMKSRGRRFRHDSSLFLKERGNSGLTTNLVQNMMRTVALKSGLIDEENNGKAFNPLGPHALRESFGSIMINSGVPDTIVDFWLGHKIGSMSNAYKKRRYAEVRRMYVEREQFISVSVPTTGNIEREIRQHNETIARITVQNTALINRIQSMEQSIKELKNNVLDISTFEETYRKNPRKMIRQVIYFNHWIQEHWKELAEHTGLTMEEVYDIIELLEKAI